MSWLLNFSTRTKLVLGSGSILALMLLAVMSGYQGITALQESQKRIYSEEFADAMPVVHHKIPCLEVKEVGERIFFAEGGFFMR